MDNLYKKKDLSKKEKRDLGIEQHLDELETQDVMFLSIMQDEIESYPDQSDDFDSFDMDDCDFM